MKTRKILSILLSGALAAGIVTSSGVTAFAASSYSADSDNTHAITADGNTVSYDSITVTKTGNGEGDEADFYGENAAVFATNGATLTITNADITTNGNYANAVFSYGEGTTVNISDSTIKTSKRNSGGIMVTGGGTLNAENLTIVTEGGSSAAIRSDRGGGTINVNGGSYTANGSGSPAIYSTADINVSDATLTSGSAQAVVVEGGNTVTLTNCDVTANNTVQNSDKSDYYQAVMLYQSMSGDAAGGSGSFTMNGGSLTSLNGGMFFVTNATYTINLSDVDMTYADDELLRACAAGWGTSGSNGGQVTLNADNQVLEGSIIVDSVSALNMYLTNGSSFTGSFENEGEVYLEISNGSTWTLTADSSISSLSCEAGSINLNGYTLTVGGTEYTEGSASTGTAVEFSESNTQQTQGNVPTMPGENNTDSQPSQGNVPVKPEENNTQQTQNNVPAKPEEANTQQPQGNVPAKPEESNTQQTQNNVPAKPEEANTQQPLNNIPVEPEEASTQQPQGNVPAIPGANNSGNQQIQSNVPVKPEEANTQQSQGTVPAKPAGNNTETQQSQNNVPSMPTGDRTANSPAARSAR